MNRPDAAPPARDAAIWSRYWRHPVLHSCANAFRDNYGDAIGAWWRERFDALRDAAVVVDIGTGNGALPLLAREAAEARGIRLGLHGVDAADIDPARAFAGQQGRFAGIRFHPRTPAERLPFDDGGVDLVTGQYALEYMPREPTVAEIARVLAPAGRAAFVMHAAEALPVVTGREQLGHCRLLFEDSGLFEAVEGLARLMAAHPGVEGRQRLQSLPEAAASRDAVNAAAARVSARIAEGGTVDLLQLALGASQQALALAQRGEGEPALEGLASMRGQLQDERARLQDLVDAALDRDGLAAWEAAFAAHGLATRSLAPLGLSSGITVGWAVEFGRPA